MWLLETTGSADAADLKAELDTELRQMLSDKATFEKLQKWEKEVSSPLLKRQANVLIRAFKQNLIPQPLLEELAHKEAALSQTVDEPVEIEGGNIGAAAGGDDCCHG